MTRASFRLSTIGVILTGLITMAVVGLLRCDVDSVARVRLIESLSLDRLRSNAAIRPEPFDLAAVERHRRTAAAWSESLDVLFLGDSITARWATQGKPVWETAFGDWKVLQLGIGGERTQNLLWRMQHDQLAGLKPRLIVLLIGTNNLGHDTTSEIVAGIAAVLAAIRVQCPDSHVLMLGLLPRGPRADAPIRGRVRAVNDRLAALADGMTVHFADFAEHFVEPDGRLSEAVAPDGLHLSEEGYRRWAAALRPWIDKLMPPRPEPPASP